MKYYIDFEATQFSHRIISIGVVAETGASFYSLCKPYKDKVSNFITNLTGITNEMAQNAPEPDLVFQMLSNWLAENSYNLQEKSAIPIFYCYGAEDRKFLEHTIKHMTNVNSIMIAQAIINNLVDMAKITADFFHKTSNLATLYNFINPIENFIQHHNALEDAHMLKVIAENFEKYNPEDIANAPQIAASVKIVAPKAPEIFVNWPDGKGAFKKADTRGTPHNYECSCFIPDLKETRYFDSIKTAALWIIKYFTGGYSPKREEDIKYIMNKINNAIINNKSYFGFVWNGKENK